MRLGNLWVYHGSVGRICCEIPTGVKGWWGIHRHPALWKRGVQSFTWGTHTTSWQWEKAPFCPSPRRSPSCRLPPPRKSPGIPWGAQHSVPSPGPSPGKLLAKGVGWGTHAGLCLVFPSHTFFWTILSVPGILMSTARHMEHAILPSHAHSSVSPKSKGREDHAYSTDRVNRFPFSVSHVCFNWYLINAHSKTVSMLRWWIAFNLALTVCG